MKNCSFCNKNQNDVFKLVFGPTVAICDECASLANDICQVAKNQKEKDNIKEYQK